VATLLIEQHARAALQVSDYGYVIEMGEITMHGKAPDLAQDQRVIDSYLGLAKKANNPGSTLHHPP
jgi:branched-chain amino acid transport system ATP-binding protein